MRQTIESQVRTIAWMLVIVIFMLALIVLELRPRPPVYLTDPPSAPHGPNWHGDSTIQGPPALP